MSNDNLENEIRKNIQSLVDKIIEQAIIDYKAKQENLKRETIDNVETRLRQSILPQIHSEGKPKKIRAKWTEDEIRVLTNLINTRANIEEFIYSLPDKTPYHIMQKVNKLRYANFISKDYYLPKGLTQVYRKIKETSPINPTVEDIRKFQKEI